MKIIAIFFMLLAAFGLVLTLSPSGAEAAGSEKLYVCGPCSSYFIEEAKAVVEEMGISDKVVVTRSSCLGACAEPAVMEFRGIVYVRMTAEKLKAMLESEVLQKA